MPVVKREEIGKDEGRFVFDNQSDQPPIRIANQPDHKAIQVKLAEAECGSLSVYVGQAEETARVEVGEGWL